MGEDKAIENLTERIRDELLTVIEVRLHNISTPSVAVEAQPITVVQPRVIATPPWYILGKPAIR